MTDRIRVLGTFMSTNGAVMVDKNNENRHETELHQEERRPWERPVLSEASLRHFTQTDNHVAPDDNLS